jgi:hypothetical protein
MEVQYSSVPEVKNPLKGFIIFSAVTILIGIIVWYINKDIQKAKNEDSNLREG